VKVFGIRPTSEKALAIRGARSRFFGFRNYRCCWVESEAPSRLYSSEDGLMISGITDTRVLLSVCAFLVAFGMLVIVASSGIFMNLLGAGILAAGGTAAYLLLSNRKSYS
jgi:hypothetical protein